MITMVIYLLLTAYLIKLTPYRPGPVMDGYSVLDGLSKMAVGMKKRKSVSSRKKRYWRPNSTDLAEFCQNGDTR